MNDTLPLIAEMDAEKIWTFVIVGLSFALYIGIGWWAQARTTSEFYVAGSKVGAVANGMATAAGWMSAASFISMAGLMAFLGQDGAMYLMGWTGGYVLLALLLAPYLRKFGKYTVPDFVGERYYSQTARVVALVCAIFVSFTYVAGQMQESDWSSRVSSTSRPNWAWWWAWSSCSRTPSPAARRESPTRKWRSIAY